MSIKNFTVKNGISVGSNEIISANGDVIVHGNLMLDDHMLVSSTGDLTVPGNLIIGSTTIQANVNDHANSAYNQANTATTNAGSASSYANAAYLQANTANTNAATADQRAVTSGVYANAAYLQANTATTNAATADQRAVTSGVYANAAFITANTKYNSTGGTISGDVNITGNLNITGNTVTHASDSLVINDPLILLANNNPGNLLDTGFIAHYIEGGTTKHTGLVRDSSANTYYLFDSYTPHIQETNILDPNDASLRITTLRSNLISDSVLVRGYDVVNHTNTAFSQANTATTNAATADQRAVTSGVYANSAFATANSKTSNVGTVTSVGGTGSYGGLTLTGTVTTSGSLTLGGTPTGTWPISVTGNAATATALQTARTIGGVSFNGTANINLPGVNTAGNQNTTGSAATLASGQSNWSGTGVLGNVVGLLAWKNYGNGHVIFDASQSTTPSGGACNNTNSTEAWTGTYPTLMGWNGSTTYGVRVDRARLADSIVSQTNSATITAATAATGSTIVLRDGSGHITGNYIFGNYFNAGSGNSENPTIGQIWTQSTGDNYLRKSTPAHVISQLELVSKLGSSYYQVNTWLQLNGVYGLYAPSVNGAHFYPNTSSSYGEWATSGSRNGYSGNYSTHSGVNGMMFDGGGNGGAYREANGRWYWYYHLSNNCMGIGTSSTSSDYSLYVDKGLRALTTIYTQGGVYGSNFYSWNDASYYVTPAGQSRLNNVLWVATNGSGNWPQQVQHPDRGIYFINSSGSAIPLYFSVNSGSTVSGYILTSGATTQYITSSDYRMKENVQDLDKNGALNKILSTKPRTFKWLDIHGGKVDVGFIAHELQEVAPECVSGEKDGLMPDGKILPQGVDTTFLMPTLCAAIQKQQELIEQLIAEVATLKGN